MNTRIQPLRRWPEAALTSTAPWRWHAAAALRRVSTGLVRLAEALALGAARPRRAPELEFYAEAGAPEGALYVDGKLIGLLPGVTRL